MEEEEGLTFFIQHNYFEIPPFHMWTNSSFLLIDEYHFHCKDIPQFVELLTHWVAIWVVFSCKLLLLLLLTCFYSIFIWSKIQVRSMHNSITHAAFLSWNRSIKRNFSSSAFWLHWSMDCTGRIAFMLDWTLVSEYLLTHRNNLVTWIMALSWHTGLHRCASIWLDTRNKRRRCQ